MVRVEDHTGDWKGWALRTNFTVLTSGVSQEFAEQYAFKINQIFNQMVEELDVEKHVTEQTALPLGVQE
jgi:L-arabinose isomerase